MLDDCGGWILIRTVYDYLETMHDYQWDVHAYHDRYTVVQDYQLCFVSVEVYKFNANVYVLIVGMIMILFKT